jgi:hypothetical protein
MIGRKRDWEERKRDGTVGEFFLIVVFLNLMATGSKSGIAKLMRSFMRVWISWILKHYFFFG